MLGVPSNFGSDCRSLKQVFYQKSLHVIKITYFGTNSFVQMFSLKTEYSDVRRMNICENKLTVNLIFKFCTKGKFLLVDSDFFGGSSQQFSKPCFCL